MPFSNAIEKIKSLTCKTQMAHFPLPLLSLLPLSSTTSPQFSPPVHLQTFTTVTQNPSTSQTATSSPLTHTEPKATHVGSTQTQQHETSQCNARFKYTYSTPNQTKIYDIIKHMRSNATPSPDGLNAAFYKYAWNWVKDDIYQVVTDFYTTAHLPFEINQILFPSFLRRINLSFPKIIYL
jgi:hypothetical protein